jgi:cytochrome c-type protein NapB
MKRLFLLGVFAVLMMAVIVIWSKSYFSAQEEAYVQLKPNSEYLEIPSEKGVFQRSNFANDYSEMGLTFQGERNLETYYENRAFHGAPPYIPHDIADEISMGGNSCLKCHENGGYVEKYKAFTPVVPHPEKVNCRQCHVVKNTDMEFTSFEYRGFPKPGENHAAFEGAPPIIPHQSQLHENCLACHAGPAAPKEIWVAHPERSNCRQCHVVNNKIMTDIGEFIR